MDWLSDLWRSAVTVGEDYARKALGVQSPDAPAKVAEAKGADTVQRSAREQMPSWLWLVLAGLVLVALAIAWRR